MSQRELVVSTSLEYAPPSFVNEKGKFVGFDVGRLFFDVNPEPGTLNL